MQFSLPGDDDRDDGNGDDEDRDSDNHDHDCDDGRGDGDDVGLGALRHCDQDDLTSWAGCVIINEGAHNCIVDN